MLRSLAVVITLFVAGCAPGSFDTGAADVTLTPDDGDPLRLLHDPGVSSVTLTPPVDGEVELTFSYNDPLVDVVLRVSASEVSEGEVVALPAAPSALVLDVVHEGVSYGSGSGSAGEVTLQVLLVDEATGAAEVSALLDATLAASDGSTLGIDGFIEGSVEGSAPEGDE